MAYVLKPEKQMEIMALLESGASIREAMRIAGVAKQTVHSIAKGRRNFGGRPAATYPRHCTRCDLLCSREEMAGSGGGYKKSICKPCNREVAKERTRRIATEQGRPERDPERCRYMKQAERIALWRWPVPVGLVLASSCHVPYCGNPEHFILRKDGNSGDRDYSELCERARALGEGDYFDLPDEPNHERAVIKFRSGMMSGMKLEHFIFRSLPTGGMRVIRYGDYYDGQRAFQAAFPVLDVRQAAPVNGMRPGCFYLGFMRAQEVRELDMRPVNKCTVKACIFPVNGNGKGLCHRHGHFFEYAAAMRGKFDPADIYAKDGQPHPNFYTGWLWEDKYNWANVRFDLKGARDPGMKLSEGWWAAHVANKQGGNHPADKPREKFVREALSDLPVWAPPVKEINDDSYRELETVYDDDEYEREIAMSELSTMEKEFEEAFTE